MADELYKRMIDQHESFWTSVYPLFMRREITRNTSGRWAEGSRGSERKLQDRGASGHMESRDYKRFLNFLRKHD